MTQIIGIDPGITGAVAIVSQTGSFVDCFDMPTVVAGKTTNKLMVSAPELARLLRCALTNAPAEVVAVIELVNAMPSIPGANGERRQMGAASAFSQGKSYGIVLGVLAALGISTEIISPQVWKRFHNLGKEKEQSRELAQRLWPAAPLHLKKHHGRAEALLLSRFYADTKYRPLPQQPF